MGDLMGRNLLEPGDFSAEELAAMFDLADSIADDSDGYSRRAAGKILATLFLEPSTRTRLRFESALLRLGGQVIGFSEASSSSAMKGESIADTVRTVACYADIIAMRHPKEGSARIGAGNSSVPIINAGDGGHHHPTQTLTDMLTIRRRMGRLDNLTIGLAGDLKFGRTVHSLINAMKVYSGIKFVLMSPEELKVPDYVIRDIESGNGSHYVETTDMQGAMKELDILYMTRVQRERFFNEEDYIRLKDSYILDNNKMSYAKDDMIVLHPLPRVNEIAVEVDSDPRAVYFEQARNGMFIRMALIISLLGL
jgi:aspartate carbamoyltransferase catalytic subunit